MRGWRVAGTGIAERPDLFYAAKWTDVALGCEIKGTSGPDPHVAGLQLGHEAMGRGAPHRLRLLFSRHDDLEVEAVGTRLWKAGSGEFPAGNWLRLRLEMAGDRLAVFRDGKLVREIDISAAPVRTGGVYFYSCAGGAARLRNTGLRRLKP